jgi:hypothetical protein
MRSCFRLIRFTSEEVVFWLAKAYLGERHAGKSFEDELLLLPRHCAPVLPFVDPGGGDGRQSHAVPQEQDDVLGAVEVAIPRQDVLEVLLSLRLPKLLICNAGNILLILCKI